MDDTLVPPAPALGAMVARGGATTLDADFAEAYRVHGAGAAQLAYLLCGDRHRAEDAVAEAFARTYPLWKRGRVDDIGAYVRRAVVNEVRSRGRRQVLERREETRRSGGGRGPRAPDEQVADRDAVLQALQRLPVRQRAAIVLRFYEDRSDTDAAAVLGVRVGTVRSQVWKGLQTMRRLLEKGEDR